LRNLQKRTSAWRRRTGAHPVLERDCVVGLTSDAVGLALEDPDRCVTDLAHRPRSFGAETSAAKSLFLDLQQSIVGERTFRTFAL
jgi:hypothetical protein